MISRRCIPSQFIEVIKDKDYPEIIHSAHQELQEVKNLPWSGKGVDKAKRESITDYIGFLEGFLFFMNGSGIKPSSISNSDFQLLRPMCERLVQKGQFKPEVMTLFE
jgi:hypothetical protein